MYSRSYYPEAQEKINLPENYDGTAFMENTEPQREEITEVSFSDATPQLKRESKADDGSILTGLGKVPILSGLFGNGGLLGGINLQMPKIGTEEILILAAAAFLFFSKDGDKETAIILLLLLLIG